MSAITTHVLDTSRGRPAAGIAVVLERYDGDAWEEMGRGSTDADGRLRSLLPAGAPVAAGTYRLLFETGAWFDGLSTAAFYPRVVVEFVVTAGDAHYHVPLLLSPFGYSTYRGS
jgi:5-hydroxyisourate hydrolase